MVGEKCFSAVTERAINHLEFERERARGNARGASYGVGWRKREGNKHVEQINKESGKARGSKSVYATSRIQLIPSRQTDRRCFFFSRSPSRVRSCHPVRKVRTARVSVMPTGYKWAHRLAWHDSSSWLSRQKDPERRSSNLSKVRNLRWQFS